MEFDDDNGTNNNCNSMWEWQGDEYSLQIDTRNELSHSFWDKLSQSEDDLLYMLNEHTPSKDCADFGHSSLSDLEGDATAKTLEGSRDSMQRKRRRMLQFTSDAGESPSEQMASALLKAKASVMEDEVAQWTSAFSEYYQDLPAMETDPTPAPVNLDVFKGIDGKNSCIRGPPKLTTSVAYPFALIKPCGVHGDLTLSDINRRIHTPHSKSKHKKNDDPFDLYPTSAFSGKPVVVKTKIRTEGGQGSITIMRTKG